ncbi:MAG: metallophosphoesterase [Chloroflexaceae bacterium]|nr:metallophosphoesterase [Chloroflexaceae bacterium]
MTSNFRFAVVSDPHITVPQTLWDHPARFHLVEISIPVIEQVFAHLEQFALDFLLLPGDLTQHGEPDNHRWLAQRLSELPFPSYVIPGNHDVPTLEKSDRSVGFRDFPHYYREFGYEDPNQLYYTREILPGVQLIALNSNLFDDQGKQIGALDEAQFSWLREVLQDCHDKLVLLTIHHNVVEHLPGQARHDLGKRYMLANAPRLREILHEFGVKLVFTGHLHVQDVASDGYLYDIVTGSLVSYPHPYRVIDLETGEDGKQRLKIKSYRVEGVPGWEDLQRRSREWLGERALPFMTRLLTSYPLNLSAEQAAQISPELRYFWADIAGGDACFDFPAIPPAINRHLQRFGAVDSRGVHQAIDNQAVLKL